MLDRCRDLNKPSRGDNHNNHLLFFVHIFSSQVWHSCLITNMISPATLFPLGPHRTDSAIYMDAQDLRPNSSYYMNSITHVYSPAWLLMGAVKQTLISQCVRTVNDQCCGQSGSNSLSTANSMPLRMVTHMFTLHVNFVAMSFHSTHK